MIDLVAFHALRLANYVPADKTIVSQDHWEYLECEWHCEMIGFTSFLTTRRDREATRCISVNFEELEKSGLRRLLRDLDLPIEPGTTLQQAIEHFGEPVKRYRFVKDRETLEFHVGDLPWTVEATIHERDGLNFLVVYPPLPKRRRP